jgi:hypothetical protein
VHYLFGAFGSRIIASVLVDLVGWRVIVVIFAGLLLATLTFTRHVLNVAFTPSAPSARYRTLLLVSCAGS